MSRKLFSVLVSFLIASSLAHPQQSHNMASMPGMVMNTPDPGNQTCHPQFSYAAGTHGPRHWDGVCVTGRMQTPIDIQHAEKLRLTPLKFEYQPSDFEVVNNCNKYQVQLRFPDNKWLMVGKKPYFLSEIDFHAPGENAVKGKRPAMSLELVHLSPESTFLIIEVPVVAGKENPVIKALLEHLPQKGHEEESAMKINAADLLPADRSFYRFPGSLTTPLCNEGVIWYLMKNPIQMSEAQIAEYSRLYHDTARPLQPSNGRPVAEPMQ